MNHDDPGLRDGDVIIRRALNGWILIQVTADDAFSPRTFTEMAFSDKREELGPPPRSNPKESAESFLELLWEGFEDLFRSKHSGGLEVTYNPKSRSEDHP